MTKPEYQFVRKLGAGGMAEVFEARQLGVSGFEKQVVVKRLLPHLRQDGQFVEMFLAEARLAAGLHHPNIVEVYDIQRTADDFFIVMEYLAGPDLRTILRTTREKGMKIPVGITCRLVADIAAGLEFAHTAQDADGHPLGIVHRDISPTNILVTYAGVPKLLDFGVAKANSHNIYTRPGTMKGKYGYASPEQVQHKSIDARSDVFALGVILHELLVGRQLFRGANPAAVVSAVMEAKIPAPSALNPEVSEELDHIIAGVLTRSRDRRTQTAGLLHEQLERLMLFEGLETSSHDVGAWVEATVPWTGSEIQIDEGDLSVGETRAGPSTAPHASSRPRSTNEEASRPAERSRGSEPAEPKSIGPEVSRASAPSPRAMDSTRTPPAGAAFGSLPSGELQRSTGAGDLQRSNISGVHVQPLEPQPRRQTSPLLIVLLSSVGTLVIVLLLGGVFWLGRQRAAPRRAPSSSRRRRPHPPQPSPPRSPRSTASRSSCTRRRRAPRSASTGASSPPPRAETGCSSLRSPGRARRSSSRRTATILTSRPSTHRRAARAAST